ncbi:MAG: DNA translocase FtsK, partial [Duncaniella sp.]|nr:DNA translocase FtsK [Duncaniella sp.]
EPDHSVVIPENHVDDEEERLPAEPLTGEEKNVDENREEELRPIFRDSPLPDENVTEYPQSTEDEENIIAIEEPESPAITEEEQEKEDTIAEAPLGSLGTLYDPRADLSNFRFPSIDILPKSDTDIHGYNEDVLRENMNRITKTLNDYNISIESIEATVGPTVILYEIVPAEGVRVARVKNLEDDLALKLAAVGVRIIAPMPGRGTIGIEVPREDPQTVSMRSVIDSPEFRDSGMELPMAIGRTVSNQVFVKDLAKMPHLLVAGATGMGKSVGLNAIITSLLYKKHPSELKLVLIDPKQVEFSIYAKLERHYLAKLPDEEESVIIEPTKAIATLNSLCVEMENRYALLKKADMRNIKDYNDRFIHRQLNPNDGHKFLPYIVVIVDEFADLIMMAGKDIETPIARIAQKARAVGIHMIIATQRPSTNVITGLIKANFPGRIAFRVFQMVDSRTILDRPGANQLIGRGDLLFSNNGKIDRVQCAFIDTPEVIEICRQISSQTAYPNAYELPEYAVEGNDASASAGSGKMSKIGDRDELFEECARHVVSANLASTSALQRHYSIGFNRAGKIMDQMEAVGIVGPAQGGKPRQVLTDLIGLEAILASI